MTAGHPENQPKADRTVAQTEWAALLGAAVDAIVVIDHKGVVETFNSAAERMFGYDAAEVVGANVNVLMPASESKAHDGYLARYRDTGQRHIIGVGREVVGRRRDGSTFPVELSVGESYSKEATHFVGILRDVSDRHATLRALEEEHALNQRYLDLAQVIMVNLDNTGKITMINRRGLEVFGYKEHELLGQDWFDCCLPEEVVPANRRVFEALMTGDTRPAEFFENPILTRDGEIRVVEWRNSVMRDSFGEIVGSMSSGMDITDRHRQQEEVRQAHDRLSQFGRLSTIGEMAAGLAHEINQPLTAIAAYIQTCRRQLLANTAEPQVLLETAEKINAQALRAGEVIKRLRNFVAHHEDGRCLMDCVDLVKDVMTLAELDAKSHGVRLTIRSPSQPVLVNVDEVQIQQVILNLIRNGIDAMTDTESENRDLILTVDLESKTLAKIAVTDFGSGVSDEAANRLFDPFFTTKPTGMGLGLPMCRSIVDAHGGLLSFERNQPAGTTFFFTLPIQQQADDGD